MTVLGPLRDEPPEPMTKEAFDAIRKRIRTSWNGSVTLEKKQVEALIQEISWLKKRLHRVESAIQPLVDELRPARRRTTSPVMIRRIITSQADTIIVVEIAAGKEGTCLQSVHSTTRPNCEAGCCRTRSTCSKTR